MKISELVTELQKYDGNKEVFVWDWLQNEHVKIKSVSLYDSDDKHTNDNPLGININDEESDKYGIERYLISTE